MQEHGRVHKCPIYQSWQHRAGEGGLLTQAPPSASAQQRSALEGSVWAGFFIFLMRQDQAQDVTPVSWTGDGGEKCLGKQGRKKWKLPCSRRREGRKKEEEAKKNGVDRMGLA